jgi:hypothetical protein
MDRAGNRIRHYSSVPPDAPALVGNAPEIWFAPPAVLATTPGLHRFVWDLRAEDPLTLTYGYFGAKLDYIEYTLPDHSIPGLTPRQQPPGPLVPPGSYTVVLKVDGKEYRQSLQVDLDPRVHATQADLLEQWSLARQITSAMSAAYQTYNEFAALQSAVGERKAALAGKDQFKTVAESLEAVEKQAHAIGEGSDDAQGIGPINRDLSRFLVMIESADQKPAASARSAVQQACDVLQKDLSAWQKLKAGEVLALNKQLENAHLPVLPTSDKYLEPARSD